MATAVEVGVLLAVPFVLGGTVGFFELNPKQAELLAPVGSEAHLLLEPFPDDHLVVEIAYDASVGPPPGAALRTLFVQINRTCEKASVTFDLHAFSAAPASLDLSGLLSLEGQLRQHWPSWGTMSLFILYLDAASSQPNVLGEAFRGGSIAIFERTIEGTVQPPVTVAEVTAAVMVHELGEELGLVGIDGYAPNEDPSHSGLSGDPADVMYWAVDSASWTRNLTAPPPTNFSGSDLSDLGNVRADVIPYEILPWAVLAASLLAATIAIVLARRDRLGQGSPTP